MILSILIPTVIGRERPLELLTNRIYSQIGDLKAESKVEVIVICDNKEISIGEKRNRLYTAASGEFSVQIDDDDDVAGNYVFNVLKAPRRP